MSLKETWLGLVAALIAALLIGGCVYDILAGETELRAVVVIGKEYTPPWVETTTRFVAATAYTPGRVEFDTTHHPARYAILTADAIRVSITAGQYHVLEKGAEIRIARKVGRWTGIGYGWSIPQ